MKDQDKVNVSNDEKLVQVRGAIFDRMVNTLVNEKRGELRHKKIKRIFQYIFLSIGLLVFLQVQMGLYGYSVLPSDDTVGIVPFTGVVGNGRPASGDAVIPVLEDLFNAENIKGIVLLIQSGGGSPNESERINQVIDTYKKKTGKKVIAVCDGMCASAAYMVAIHADKIYASRYTLVGSIGAIMQGWDFHKTIDLADANYRVFASGELKDMMNSYKPLNEAKSNKLQGLVNEMGDIFKREVQAQRSDKLVQDRALFTGEIWDSNTALNYGLIDQVGTLEKAIASEFPEMKSKRFVVRKAESSLLNKLFSSVSEELKSAFGQDDDEAPIQFKWK